jgi:predicted outer membrane lipoprotein
LPFAVASSSLVSFTGVETLAPYLAMLLGLPFSKAFGVMEKMTVSLSKIQAEAAHLGIHHATFVVAAPLFYIVHISQCVTRKVLLPHIADCTPINTDAYVMQHISEF